MHKLVKYYENTSLRNTWYSKQYDDFNERNFTKYFPVMITDRPRMFESAYKSQNGVILWWSHLPSVSNSLWFLPENKFMWRTFSKQKNQNIRHHKSLSAFQQIIASHQFQDDCEVDNVASRRLMIQDTEHHQHGVEKLTIFLFFWGGGLHGKPLG